MLQRVQAEERHARHIFIGRKNPDHATLFTRMIIMREHQ
jgi:hypothetical protein